MMPHRFSKEEFLLVRFKEGCPAPKPLTGPLGLLKTPKSKLLPAERITGIARCRMK
jgi:hypothetical protein